MQPISRRIADSEKLTRLIGSWPSFHDAEILPVELYRGPSEGPPQLSATFQICLMATARKTVVRMLFTGVEDLKLEDFNHQNVIYEMRILDSNDSTRIRVEIDTSFGMSGAFTCERAEVLAVSQIQKE